MSEGSEAGEGDRFNTLRKAKDLTLGDFDDLNVLRKQTRFKDESDDDDMDDLEKQIDFDQNDEDVEKFKNELLFFVQGLGSTKKHNDLEIYLKGSHCEDSLKDIIKCCRKDFDDVPSTRIELGKWEVLQKDLLQLLVSQHQDKQLTYWLLMLLTQLTEYPRDKCTRKNELIGYLQVT